MALPTRQTRPAPAPGGDTATTSGNWLMLAVLLLGQPRGRPARQHPGADLDRAGRRGPRPGAVGQPAAHPVTDTRARSPGGRRVRPAHHHGAARPVARRGRHRLGLPVPRGRVPHLRHGARGRLGHGDVRHGLLAGRPVRRRPAGRGGHGPGRTGPASVAPLPVIRMILMPNGPSLTPSAGQPLFISIESMSNVGNPMNCCMTFSTRSSRILSTLPTGPWLTG